MKNSYKKLNSLSFEFFSLKLNIDHITFFPPQAGDLVNPTRKSLFSQRMLDKKESLYASRKNAPLGNAIKSILSKL